MKIISKITHIKRKKEAAYSDSNDYQIMHVSIPKIISIICHNFVCLIIKHCLFIDFRLLFFVLIYVYKTHLNTLLL